MASARSLFELLVLRVASHEACQKSLFKFYSSSENSIKPQSDLYQEFTKDRCPFFSLTAEPKSPPLFFDLKTRPLAATIKESVNRLSTTIRREQTRIRKKKKTAWVEQLAPESQHQLAKPYLVSLMINKRMN